MTRRSRRRRGHPPGNVPNTRTPPTTVTGNLLLFTPSLSLCVSIYFFLIYARTVENTAKHMAPSPYPHTSLSPSLSLSEVRRHLILLLLSPPFSSFLWIFLCCCCCCWWCDQMEVQNPRTQAPLPGERIEIDADLPLGETSLTGKRLCGEAACGFSDISTGSKDAKERSASMRKLVMAVVLCALFMSVEVVGGIKSNSLAILTDAAHLLSDVAAFAISLFSIWAAGWKATPRQSYGFFRIEILGALVSIQLIWLLAGILVYEAVARIIHDTGEVKGFLMFAVSAFGLVVNIIMAALLGHDHGHSGHGHDHYHVRHSHDHGHDHNHDDHDNHTHHVQHSHRHGENDHDHGRDIEHGHGHVHDSGPGISTHNHHSQQSSHKDEHEPLLKHTSDAENLLTDPKQKRKHRNINVHSAYLHVLGDSIQSIGVMIGGGMIWYKPEWKIIDLICTLVFSVIVLATTVSMLRNILDVLMESTPREIDAKRLEKGLCHLHDVVAVHELHIWAITVGKVLLACHVTITPEADADHVLHMVVDYIRREYNITHVTIQIELSQIG